MFIARYLVGVRKRRKARPRWEKTERDGDVVDDDDDDDDNDDDDDDDNDDEVDDGSDGVGQERGKKQSKGKEGKKTKKTPNNSAPSLSPSLHPHNYLFSSTSSISSIPLDLP
jgi:hypothetical protein